MISDIWVSKTKIVLITLALIAVFFPYISPIHTPSDTQPWALVFALLLLLVICYEQREKFFRNIPGPLKMLGIIFIYTGIVFFVHLFFLKDADFVLGLRSIFGYFSLIILTYFGFKFWQDIPGTFFIGAVGAWFIGAIDQVFFGFGIFAPLLHRFATGGFRGFKYFAPGFTSFAPEPAFYATMCIYFLILNEFLYKQKKYSPASYIGIVIVLLTQIVMSYSGVGLMMLLLFLLGKGIELLVIKSNSREKKVQATVLVLSLIVVSLFLFNKSLNQSRSGALLQTSVTEPSALADDTSVTNRLGNPVLALYGGIFKTYGIGFGLGTKSTEALPSWLDKLTGGHGVWGGRIEGGFSQTIYELGIVGFILIGIILYIIGKSIIYGREYRGALIISFMTAFVSLFIFGAIANPLAGLLLGIHLYFASNKNESFNHNPSL
ncbi:MAG TPA: hypothetical protein VL306_00405 [Methylomirabilota bacterium]|jgi:hypothetical protein|nr:hypothetical protein [Methylomirabilota bacterium]